MNIYSQSIPSPTDPQSLYSFTRSAGASATRADHTVNGKRDTGKGADATSMDSAFISKTARALFAQNSEEASAAGKKGIATLSATTNMGTNISVRAKSTDALRMGGAGSSLMGAAAGSAFALSEQENGASSAYTVTFTKADGTSQEFDVAGSTRFYQLPDGSISAHEPMSQEKQQNGGQAIILNLEEGANVEGSKNDDVILNMARNARINAGAGNDRIVSMGDGADIDGGMGNDSISVLKEKLPAAGAAGASTAQKEEQRKKASMPLFTAASDSAQKTEGGKPEREKGSQTVQVRGGEGDDAIESKVTLFESLLDGGEGDDFMDMGNVQLSHIKGGAGDDRVQAREVTSSLLQGNDGNDFISAHILSDSTIDAGGGNDMVRVGSMMGSSIYGGEGDDAIMVDKIIPGTEKSLIDGGEGNDAILATVADQGILSGDAATVEITGGEGQNAISVQYEKDTAGNNSTRIAPRTLSLRI